MTAPSQGQPSLPGSHRLHEREQICSWKPPGFSGLVIDHHQRTPRLTPKRSPLPGQGRTSELLGPSAATRPSLPPLLKQARLLQSPCSHPAMLVWLLVLGGVFSSLSSLNEEKPDLQSCNLVAPPGPSLAEAGRAQILRSMLCHLGREKTGDLYIL